MGRCIAVHVDRSRKSAPACRELTVRTHKRGRWGSISSLREPHFSNKAAPTLVNNNTPCKYDRLSCLRHSISFNSPLSTMFVLPTLVYALLGATIAWASPAPTAPTPKPTDAVVPPTPDLGINCRGSGYCDRGKAGSTWELVAYISQISDNAWYNNGQQIGAVVFFHNVVGFSCCLIDCFLL